MLYCFLAPGFEETEAIAPLDVLRRAGVDVKTVGVGARQMTGSHGIPVLCDMTIDEIELDSALEGVMLPGGMPGTRNLAASETVCEALRFCADNNKLLCAICAAPSVPGKLGLLKGKTAVCFPGFEGELLGASVSENAVVTDGNVITAKGAGVALEFGFAVIRALKGAEKADEIRRAIQCP